MAHREPKSYSVLIRTRLRYATPWQAGTATAWRCRNIAAARCRPTPCALRHAPRQPTEHYALCFGIFVAHSPQDALCAPPYTSVPIRTYPYGLAHSIGSAPCAPPANRTLRPVLWEFPCAWHTVCPAPLRTHPYTSVLIRTALLTVSALRNAPRQPTVCAIFSPLFSQSHLKNTRKYATILPVHCETLP